jgi:hypothetical protein
VTKAYARVIGQVEAFYYAEDYHQQYLAKPGARPVRDPLCSPLGPAARAHLAVSLGFRLAVLLCPAAGRLPSSVGGVGADARAAGEALSGAAPGGVLDAARAGKWIRHAHWWPSLSLSLSLSLCVRVVGVGSLHLSFSLSPCFELIVHRAVTRISLQTPHCVIRSPNEPIVWPSL